MSYFSKLEDIAHYESKSQNTVKTNFGESTHTHVHTHTYTHTHTHTHRVHKVVWRGEISKMGQDFNLNKISTWLPHYGIEWFPVFSHEALRSDPDSTQFLQKKQLSLPEMFNYSNGFVVQRMFSLES